jgi:hypothetical protein
MNAKLFDAQGQPLQDDYDEISLFAAPPGLSVRFQGTRTLPSGTARFRLIRVDEDGVAIYHEIAD